MTNRFQTLFADPNHHAFIPYFTLGDPTPQLSLQLLKKIIDKTGIEAIELGMPFTDPVADGPTNQRSMARALKADMNFSTGLTMLTELRHCYPNLAIGLLLYYNLIFARGIPQCYAQLAQAGVDALVCAELPLEESATHEAALKQHQIGCVHMVFPNTPLQRAQQCFERSSAFTYVVARSGTTGEQTSLASNMQAYIKDLRTVSDKPIVVGFGLSKPEHVATVFSAGANGAIIGSLFSSWIEENLTEFSAAENKIVDFIKHVVSVTAK